MKYDVYLLNYNNYYNRQVKKLNTIADYISSSNGYFLNEAVQNINFAFGDGLNSELIINQSYVNKQPDYVIIEERDHEAGVEGKFSRWFIIDSNLTRGGQYHFTIKRDVCADFYDIMMNSTYFIERGWVSDSSDLIFNNEEQQYSQIKKSQTPLYDETGVSWIVGYMPKQINKTSDTYVYATYQPDDSTDYVVSSLSNWDYWDYVSSNPNHESIFSDDVTDPYCFIVQLPIKTSYTGGVDYQMTYMAYSLTSKTTYAAPIDRWQRLYPSTFTVQESGLGYFNRTQSGYESDVSDKQWWNESTTSIQSYRDVLNRTIFYKQPSQLTGTLYDDALAAYKQIFNINNSLATYVENNINGKTIKDTSTGKVYTISLIDRIVDQLTGASGNQTAVTTAKQKILGMLNLGVGSNQRPTEYGYSSHYANAYNSSQIQLEIKHKVIQIELTEIGSAQTMIPKDDTESGGITTVYRNHTADQIYDMFAIPYKGYHFETINNVEQLVTTKLRVKDGSNYYDCNPDMCLNIAQSIVTKLGYISGEQPVVYDLQILPYCPCREYIKSDGTFDITGTASNKYEIIKYGQNLLPVGYIFFCSSSKISNITLLDKYNEYNPYSITVSDVKKSYNTEMYRLSGPNFASSFEFNPAQNNGVSSFLMSFTYKPYNPYIRVRPNFKRMYGEDFKDGRGLILQGDFSVATMSNAWTNYELNNKNYLNAFNREIASMNLQNKIAGEKDLWKAFSGSIQGIASGAVAGGMVGGGYGAIAGALIGGVSSIATGAMDVQNNKKLRNDAISKAKTLFNYQLDNIKALPNTIRNVGALTVDNVLVPVLEYYCASDDEIDTYEKKIRYYGMSIMKVGLITDYINPNQETFVQGQLLRLLSPEGVNEEADNHLAEELSNEVQKGLYIGG